MTDQIDKDELSAWQHKQISQKIWRLINDRHQPLEALLTCSPEKVEFHRGKAEILRDLSGFFEIPDQY